MPKNAQSILIVTPNWLGDSVMSLPLLRHIRAQLPNARLVVLCNSNMASLWRAEAELTDQVFIVEKRRLGVSFSLLRSLRAARFSSAIILSGSFYFPMLAWLAGIPLRVGFGLHGTFFFLTHCLGRGNAEEHMSKRFLGFLAPLQLRREHSLPSPSIPALSVPAFSISAEAEARADEYLHSLGLRPGEPFIAIAPGARNNQQKCWPLAHYCELAQTLAGGGTRLLLFGLPSELPALKLIQCAAYGKPIIVDSRNDIPYAAALLRQSQALVCNDSGLMHLAAAVGTNVVALFGPSDPLCSAPMGSAEIVLLSRSKHCPRDCLSKKHPCRCLAEIQPREVAPILSRMISPVSQRRGCNNLSEVFP